MALPKQYEYLNSPNMPKMIQEGVKLYGTKEVSGNGSNPTIVAWAKEVGQKLENVYKTDDIAWCGLFVALLAKMAGKDVVKDPLWALNWGTFGVYAETPMIGDVMVFIRKTSTGAKAGHVGLYVGEDALAYRILGGNQGDAVSITSIAKTRLYTSRRPIYTNKPIGVEVKRLNGTDKLSTNEQ